MCKAALDAEATVNCIPLDVYLGPQQLASALRSPRSQLAALLFGKKHRKFDTAHPSSLVLAASRPCVSESFMSVSEEALLGVRSEKAAVCSGRSYISHGPANNREKLDKKWKKAGRREQKMA